MVPTPLNLKQADEQGSDAFFNALLKSCSTPITSSRASSDYESTPEPFGHHEPAKLHRKHSRAAKFTTKNAVEEEESRKLLARLEEKANAPEQWPTRSSSMRRWKKHPKSVDSGYQPSSLRTSFESTPSVEEPCFEDGYDHYSNARHDVLRNHGFWPRSPEPAVQKPRNIEPTVKRPRQDYDKSPTRGRSSGKAKVSTSTRRSPHPRSEFLPEKLDLRRSLLFEPHHLPPVSFQPLPVVSPPNTISIDETLFPAPLRIRHTPAQPDSAYDSDPDLTFENTSIFQPRSPTTSYSSSSSPWPHTYAATHGTKIRPSFQDAKLEAYRLSDPGLLQNIDKPMPDLPHRSLSWQTLSREEYILALGYHAMTMSIELPLIYAAKPNIGKRWVEEDGVEEGWEGFNERVEEMCKLQLKAIERMERQDAS